MESLLKNFNFHANVTERDGSHLEVTEGQEKGREQSEVRQKDPMFTVRAGARSTISPFIDWKEWKQVRTWLFSDDPALRRKGVERVRIHACGVCPFVCLSISSACACKYLCVYMAPCMYRCVDT